MRGTCSAKADLRRRDAAGSAEAWGRGGSGTSALGAIDFGGTKTALALVRADGTVARRLRQDTPARPSPQAAVDAIASAWVELTAGLSSGEIPTGVGLAAPGPCDAPGGIVHQAFDWGWRDVPLAAMLAGRLGLPVRLDNDVNACCLAEMRFGVARGVADFVWVQLSTGVGAGLVLGGRLYAGAAGLAGEVGHMVLDEGGPLCACGRRGCLQALCSGPAIARRFAERGGAPGGAEAVFVAAAAGDERAEAVLAAVATDLGRGLALACNLLNPALVVLGGGVLRSFGARLPAVRAALAARVIGRANREVRLEASGVGYDAPLLGAAVLAEAVDRAARGCG